MLRARFDVREDEDPAAVRARVVLGVAEAWPEEERDDGRAAGRLLADLVAPEAAAMGELTQFVEDKDVPSASSDLPVDRTRTAGAFVDWVRRLSAERTVAIVVEQVQWGDDATAELVDFLLRSLRRAPVLLVLSARPDRTRHRLDAAAGMLTELELAPFGDDVMAEFIDRLFAALPRFPPETKRELVSRSEGNPEFCKELVRLLVDRGALVIDERAVPVAWDQSRLGKLSLPDSILGVLQARLDGLPPAHKELLKLASVVGRTFWLGVLEELAPGQTPEDLLHLLDDLRARDFVKTRPSSTLAGEREVQFTTQFLRDAAYELLPRPARVAAHRRVAEWLASRGELWEGKHAVLAAHLEAAGDATRARRHWLAAARQALAVSADQDAVELFARTTASWADEASKDDRVHRAGVRRERGRGERRLGGFEHARRSLDIATDQLAPAEIPADGRALG